MEKEFIGYKTTGGGNTVESRGQTGFQSPCNDYTEEVISLDRVFVRDAASTFFARMSGEAMSGDKIGEGDILMIDKARKPQDGNIVLCYYDGGFHVRRIRYGADAVELLPSNPRYSARIFGEGEELMVWGVITSVHRNIR